LSTRIAWAAAGGIASPKYGIDNSSGAAYAALYGNCLGRAIPAACPAFHAGVFVLNPCTVITVHTNYGMGTNLDARAAADTLFLT